MKKKAIGVLGGMGPEATVYFINRIIEGTAAETDQGHVPLLVWSDPRIPPRTEAILHKGPSPLEQMLSGIKLLEAGGAGLIVMPCITAHFWASDIARQSRVPFIHLLGEAVKFSLKEMPRLERAGLIASTGTVSSGLWPEAFGKKGVKILTPEAGEQDEIMNAIFGKKGIKAGFTSGPARATVVKIARRLIRRGAQAVIAGCTEIPLVLNDTDIPVPFIEPMRISARVCIRRAGYSVVEKKTGPQV